MALESSAFSLGIGRMSLAGHLLIGTLFLLTGLITAFKATTRFQAFAHGEVFWDRLLRRGSAFILFFVGLALASAGVWLQVQAMLRS